MILLFDKKVDEMPEITAKVMKFMLEEGNSPVSHNQMVIEIVKKIYEAGFRDDADDICNLYAKNGHFFLKDLYFDENDMN